MTIKIPFKSVVKRDGRIVPFDQSRITEAIKKAMVASGEGDIKKDPQRVSNEVVKALIKKYPPTHNPHIEEIQDVVEETLILLDFPKTAKAYILYRHQRAQLREKRKLIPERVKNLVLESKKYFPNKLSEFIYYRTYSRWIEEETRRETWIETIERYINFMKENLGKKLRESEYNEIKKAILNQEVMPSMRLLWSAGKAARVNNITAYNCSFSAPQRIRDFAEIMYLSMSGAGVGFSVESQTVQKLPIIKRQSGKILPIHIVEDSKEGWANALISGMTAWYNGKDIKFDFSKIRPAGTRLKTMGGRASGPEPLKALLEFTRAKILSKQGKRLSNLDVHDIICKIGEVVVMGGVRRTALISLSDLDDPEMRDAKKGQFYIENPQRMMANNSAVYNEKPSPVQFLEEWLALAKSGSGERGIFNRGSLKYQVPARRWKSFEKYWSTAGTNPCLTGDTLVYLANGYGQISIRELAKKGEDVPVFCLNKQGRVVVRMMRHPRLTGRNQPVYKITLDDGSTIKATADHKFRLRSGEYKEVKDLKRGDSLFILTRFEASLKEVFSDHHSPSQDYWWISTGKATSKAEHRLIAEFHYNTKIPSGYVVHHRNGDSQDNQPGNLEIISKEKHEAIHGEKIKGDNNPMKRAKKEWDEMKWEQYFQNISATSGVRNGRFLGVTNEQLKYYAILLTQKLGHRFSNKDWINYAKENGLPQNFSKWRRAHLGGIIGLAKWAAQELGFDNLDVDPQVLKSYKKYTSQGYDCEVVDGRLVFVKHCEVCNQKFYAPISRREYGICSRSCGLKQKWSKRDFAHRLINRVREAHYRRKERIKEMQAEIFSELRFRLGRDPLKREWVAECKRCGISPEIARKSSPLRSYQELKDFATTYNHKVVSVEFAGYEDVYNGTVDEFHNFFVGGFETKTKNGKKKFVYLNNLQCGEIILRSREFCNLTEVVARPEDTKESLLRKIKIATILGTYQSTLIDFPFLSREWRENCQEEKLLGVSITGQWDCPAVRKKEVLRKLKKRAIRVNEVYARRFGINPSLAITCVKPSGTVSLLVNSSAGMHARFAPYYIRRVRISATDPLFLMLRDQKFPFIHPEVGQTIDSATTFVLEFPVASPKRAIFQDDLSAIEQLEYWKLVKENYTEHNPSVTIYIGEDEWLEVAHWLYKNWDILGGLSFLPRTKNVYRLAPLEAISKEKYEEMVAKIPEIDFSNILLYEKEDETTGAKELACVGRICEIDSGNAEYH